jgi:hypothetical protein
MDSDCSTPPKTICYHPPSVIAKLKAAPHIVVMTDEDLTRPTLEELQYFISRGYVKIDQSKAWRIK